MDDSSMDRFYSCQSQALYKRIVHIHLAGESIQDRGLFGLDRNRFALYGSQMVNRPIQWRTTADLIKRNYWYVTYQSSTICGYYLDEHNHASHYIYIHKPKVECFNYPGYTATRIAGQKPVSEDWIEIVW